MLTNIAFVKSKIIIGTKKVSAKTIFEKNVVALAFQIPLDLVFSDSFDKWMPNASLNASTKAIVKIPAITTDLEFVPIPSPMITPRVVITRMLIQKQFR